MTKGIIAAISPEGVIGLEGRIPWHHSADSKRFKRVTMGATVVMGRLTWESLPRKPLPGRRNVVVTSGSIEGVECYPSVSAAVASCDEKGEENVWFIGGARIYAEAMDHADVIDLTFVPDRIDAPGAVCFPEIDERVWEAGPVEVHEDDSRLQRRVYRRRVSKAEDLTNDVGDSDE